MAEDAIASGVHRAGMIAPGTVIGSYRIEAEIGRGGMSTVYAATHIALDRVVALKVLLPSLAGDAEFVRRFLAEARAAARLDYPHIVPVYDTGEIDGLNFIAMKLLDGRDLRAILEGRRLAGQGGLALIRAANVIGQAARALDYAHQHRVVHRDVKPANIYVDDEDRVTLVDFGIARALDVASTTLTGAVIGTPAYMSPEQALGKPADFRSDIYSLGVVLYETLAGTPPFAGSPHAVMHAHANAAPAALSLVRADIPGSVDGIVQRALAKRPEDRYQSAGELAVALSHISTLLGGEEGDATAVFPNGRTSGAVTATTGPAFLGGTDAGTPLAAAPYAQSPMRTRLIGLAAAAALAIVAAVGIWAAALGPLAAKDGRLVVSSDPTGATVTVDGNNLGVTPLAAHTLPAGSHELVMDKPGYVQVKRTEQLHARATDDVNATLTVLPASELLTVQQAIVAKGVAPGPNNSITYDTQVASVHVNEEFGMLVTVMPKSIAPNDISFRQEIILLDPSGNRLNGSTPANATVARDDSAGRSFAFTFHFNANTDGSIPTGTYQLQFLIDGQPAATRPIALVS